MGKKGKTEGGANGAGGQLLLVGSLLFDRAGRPVELVRAGLQAVPGPVPRGVVATLRTRRRPG
jgi:hypothetical protein